MANIGTASVLYRNDAGLPDPSQANDGLIALFRRTLP